ncbi:MAG: sigma-70 family RNA polymerase sigma factor [Bacteroidota bacterium]
MSDLQQCTDQELLSLLKEDSQPAFGIIYERFWQPLYAIGYNRTRDVSVTEDIVHDVFTALWTNRHQAEILNLKAYLATAVKYMAIANYRKVLRRAEYTDELPESAIPAQFAERIDDRRVLELLKEEVNRLPEKCRLVFQFSREAHKSVREIADELNISTSTVENHLNKALGRLKVVFKNFNSFLFSWLL